MLFVRLFSFEQIYFVRDTLPDPLFVKPTGKISVILPALCYGEIGTYWQEVFLSERALWVVFISACKEFCMWVALWSLLKPLAAWCPRVSMSQCHRSRDISLTAPNTQQSFYWCQCMPGASQAKHHLSHTDSPSLTVPDFLSIPGFLMHLIHLRLMILQHFFSFLNGKRDPAGDLRCSRSLHDNFWFTSLPFCPQTLSHREMLLAVHAIISLTHQYYLKRNLPALIRKILTLAAQVNTKGKSKWIALWTRTEQSP